MISDALAIVRDKMPKLNPLICEGIAYHQMKGVESAVNNLLMTAFRREGEYDGEGLPDTFQYLRYERPTPDEDFLERVKRHKSGRGKARPGINMAQTDTYLIKCVFENDGEQFTKFLSIPFARYGGLINMLGTTYGIAAVLKTRGLSLTTKGYFAEFPRCKVNFDWLADSYYINGDIEHVYMPYSTSLHTKAKRQKTYVPPLACWLFAKYGLFETFEKFLGVSIEVYETSDPKLHTLDPNRYCICRATKPARGAEPEIAIVIKKDDLSPQAKILIGTVFYIARSYPDRVVKAYVGEPRLWMIMLGFAIFGKSRVFSEIRIVDEIRTHFSNIERALDVNFKNELTSVGVECSTIYEFLYYVINKMTERTGNEMTGMANLWGRYYTTTEYVIRDLREAIFNAHYAIVKAARKTGGKPVSTSQIEHIINSQLNQDIINNINSGHGEITPFMVATDNMFIGLTSHCIDQTDARKRPGGKKVFDTSDPSRHMHASFLEAGSVAHLPKSNPIGPYRINGHVKIDYFGRIMQKEDCKKDMVILQADFRAKGL